AGGDAIFLVGGDKAIADTLAPVFEVLSRAHFHVGDIGNGNRAKLAINLVLGLSRAAVAEGVVFAKAVGLDPAEFLELALQSAAASKVMASKGPKMVSRDFSALGRVTQCAKDVRLIQEQAQKAGQGLPMAERYLEVLADNLAHGEGDLDNSAVLLAIERTAAKPD
ncbi:MAG: NAD(P)-dependent oxidoreductase, partial [Rhodobacteraceae bacterium]|nr:NAD(P)-dependent oxidoreductase [Paracoccaceae bacterium]